MATPPTTPDSSLNAFLTWVFDQIEILSTGSKPEDGWALSDLQPDVSEVISDKRDLIDIVTQWDESSVNLSGWEDLTDRQYQTIEQLRQDVTTLTEHGHLFEETLMWWDANRKIIHDVKTYSETIDENLEEVISLAGSVNQTKTHIDSQRQATDLAASNAVSSANTASEKASQTTSDREEVTRLLGETEAAEASAKSSRDDTLASEVRVDLAEERTLSYRDEASHLRDLVIQDRDAVGQMKTEVEDFTLRAEAGAATVGNAEVVLEARERSVAAEGAADSSARTATEKADVATTKADEASDSAASAQSSATTATQQATLAVENREAGYQDRLAVGRARNEAVTAKNEAVAASQTATEKASEATVDADRSKSEADRARIAADEVDSAATTAAISAVNDRVNQLLQDAPEAFDTLVEIASKLVDQDDEISALISQIAVASQKAAWDQVSNKPSTYPPSSHEHTTSQINGLDDALDALQQEVEALRQIVFARPAMWLWDSSQSEWVAPEHAVDSDSVLNTDAREIHSIEGVSNE